MSHGVSTFANGAHNSPCGLLGKFLERIEYTKRWLFLNQFSIIESKILYVLLGSRSDDLLQPASCLSTNISCFCPKFRHVTCARVTKDCDYPMAWAHLLSRPHRSDACELSACISRLSGRTNSQFTALLLPMKMPSFSISHLAIARA